MVSIKFNNTFVRYAVPFIVFMVGGSFYLREFTQIKFKYKNRSKFLTEEEAQKIGVDYKPTKGTIEEEYEKMKDKDWDTWENKRIPRPWDGNTASS